MNTWKNRNVNMYKLFKKIFVEIIGNIFEFKVNCLEYRYNYKKKYQYTVLIIIFIFQLELL